MMFMIISSMAILCTATKSTKKMITINYLAKNGFKYDNVSNNDFLQLFLDIIPIINVLRLIESLKKLTIDINSDLRQLFLEKNIVPMSEEDKKLYDKNPNFLTAIDININSKSMPNCMLVYMSNNVENVITYYKKRGIKVIVETKGPISQLPRKLQYKEFYKQLKLLSTPKEKSSIQEVISDNEETLSLTNIYCYNNELNDTKEKAKTYVKKLY